MTVFKVLCIWLVTGLAMPAFAADKIVSTTDLSAPFHTRTKWSLVVDQEDAVPSELSGAIHLCFVHAGARTCPALQPFNQLGDATVVRPAKTPLLRVVAVDVSEGSSVLVGTIVWAYRPERDAFEMVFFGDVAQNVNEDVQLVERGALAGDIIVAKAPGEDAPSQDPLAVGTDMKAPVLSEAWPYRYGIALYAPTRDWHYKRLLNYRGRTNQADHVPLGVIDSEMPEIERRLGFWKPGDPLPRPQGKGHDCLSVYLHNGVEYCKLSHPN